MSKTIKMSAGDVFRNPRGAAEYVEDLDKHAQDVAYHLMTEYDADRDVGNELLSADVRVTTGDLAAQSTVATFIRQCMDRFDRHQMLIEDEIADTERFAGVKSLQVRRIPSAQDAFMYLLVTETEAGDVNTVAQVVDLTHQDLPEGFLQSLYETFSGGLTNGA